MSKYYKLMYPYEGDDIKDFKKRFKDLKIKYLFDDKDKKIIVFKILRINGSEFDKRLQSIGINIHFYGSKLK